MVDNAVKYTPEDGSVEVSMTVSDDEVSVDVTDTGLGISATDQAHVFSAFHRSTNPNALSVPGTGLGLPIARRIAESHGGTLSVDLGAGPGEHLPVHPAAALARATRPPDHWLGPAPDRAKAPADHSAGAFVATRA